MKKSLCWVILLCLSACRYPLVAPSRHEHAEITLPSATVHRPYSVVIPLESERLYSLVQDPTSDIICTMCKGAGSVSVQKIDPSTTRITLSGTPTQVGFVRFSLTQWFDPIFGHPYYHVYPYTIPVEHRVQKKKKNKKEATTIIHTKR